MKGTTPALAPSLLLTSGLVELAMLGTATVACANAIPDAPRPVAAASFAATSAGFTGMAGTALARRRRQRPRR